MSRRWLYSFAASYLSAVEVLLSVAAMSYALAKVYAGLLAGALKLSRVAFALLLYSAFLGLLFDLALLYFLMKLASRLVGGGWPGLGVFFERSLPSYASSAVLFLAVLAPSPTLGNLELCAYAFLALKLLVAVFVSPRVGAGGRVRAAFVLVSAGLYLAVSIALNLGALVWVRWLLTSILS